MPAALSPVISLMAMADACLAVIAPRRSGAGSRSAIWARLWNLTMETLGGTSAAHIFALLSLVQPARRLTAQ